MSTPVQDEIRNSIKDVGSNEVLDFALDHKFPGYARQEGLDAIVTADDHSHKCPVYVQKVPPCTFGCPADEDIRGYHNILAEIRKDKSKDKWERAFRLLTTNNPFPAVMGRVCPAPCESQCNRKDLDETVGINSVEHAIGQYALDNNLQFEKGAASTGKTVAVVGGGPGGLSCAYQLAKRGHQVTIYDSLDKLGGMMRFGIMGYRVEREVLDGEIQRILNVGNIDVKYGVKIGKDISFEELRSKHNAVFLGVGAMAGRKLPVPGGEDTEYASSAAAFLKAYEDAGSNMTHGSNIVIVGDGDVAMDVARLAMRLGANATLLSAVPREEMNCLGYEFDEAANEGAKFEYQVSVVEVLRDGDKVKGIKCVKMEKKEKGEDGWNSPIPFMRYKPVAGSEHTIDCDMIVASIGQTTDMSGLEEACKGAFLNVDKLNYNIKTMEGVFGGGDAVKIDLITTAIGHGRKAAEAIHEYVNGRELPVKVREDVVRYDALHTYHFPKRPMNKRTHNHFDKVSGNFDQILNLLGPEEACEESGRCMSCGLCFECKKCMMYCPQEAISMFRTNPTGEVMFTDYGKCIGCHICAEVCPCGYIEMGMGEDL